MMEYSYTEEDLAGLDRIVVIAGPTGVGKTALSLRLAERINAEIVSVDSLQVYRHLNIGTAKASRAERARVAHHLIDIVDPDASLNAADFRRLAGEAIADIKERGKVPLLVGGTGLYVRLLVHGVLDAPKPSQKLRRKYRRQAEQHGKDFLYRRLRQLDPELAERVHPNDLVRVTRGLEIYDQTGRALSELQREHRFSCPHYHALKIVLIRPREELYERINHRVDAMMNAGLKAEYQEILEMGYERDLKPLMSLGYRQMGEHILDGRPRDEVVDEIKRETRHYAKKQISWFRGEPQTKWAMAPVVRDDQVPPAVVDDIMGFLDSGGLPELEWAGVDPYNVKR